MISSEDNGVSDKSENISAAGTETVNTGSDPNLVIAELKKLHLKEINELRNQLDEVRTNAMIIETTKQDDLDELKLKNKQELDSLNHIISALQSDLNSIRSEYEQLNNTFKEYKKHHPQIGIDPLKSPSTQVRAENENLEEDMRKAKESADMLRSVVLPLETEITTLRSRSNTSEKRIKELEKIIQEKDKEREKYLTEESKFVKECLSMPEDQDTASSEASNDVFLNKYVKLKKYLVKNEKKFVELEKIHLKSIKQLYSMLTNDQKLRLLPNRPKSRSLSTISNKSINLKPESNQSAETSEIEQNETILKIEELLDILSLDSVPINEMNDTDVNDLHLVKDLELANGDIPIYSYAEMLAMYEKEKNTRIDIETNFQQKAKESNRQIENLNSEMSNLAAIIEDLRKQYLELQNQFRHQLDTLVSLNENIRNELKTSELKNEQYKQENLKLKAENKQFYGDQSILTKELDEQYIPVNNLDEAIKQIQSQRQEIVKLILANQALNKQHSLSLETVKNLQKINMQYQRANNLQDQMVITQSLESELERERKVRIEAEQEKNEYKNQLKLIKEKGQAIVESLKQSNHQSEFEVKKLKEENQELANQIQSLKKDAKNSLSVQEDLVRLIQSLQIELNQTKTDNQPLGEGEHRHLEVRLQHEDDFTTCASCKNQFSVTRRKHRCSHCCKIFCADCSAKNVLSGPNKRPHRVCDSCHTLLDKDLAPAVS